MASISQLTARLVDLFGTPSTANPAKLAGNLTVSPNGNILVGQTTDNAVDKLQVTGSASFTNTPVYMRGPAATYRITYFQSGTTNRWAIGADNVTETGSNAGSNFLLARYNDAGTWIDNPISITRSTGVVNFSQRPTWVVSGTTYTPWDNQNLNPANCTTANSIHFDWGSHTASQ